MAETEDRDEVLEAEVVAEGPSRGRMAVKVLLGLILAALLAGLIWWGFAPLTQWLGEERGRRHRLLGQAHEMQPPAAARSAVQEDLRAQEIPAASPADAAALAEQLAEARQEIAILAQRLDALARDVALLAARAQEPRGPVDQTVWLLPAALARIALKLESGGDLLAERLALKALTPRLPEAAETAARGLIAASEEAAAGLPGRAEILALFAKAAEQSTPETSAGGKQASWWRRLLQALGDLVRVRAHSDGPTRAGTGSPRADLPAAALTLARSRFLAGDLDQAVDALSSVEDALGPEGRRLLETLRTRRRIAHALAALIEALDEAARKAPLAPGETPQAPGP